MALNQVIYEQAPRPNPLGQALQGAAATLSQSVTQAQQMKSEKDRQLATMFMQWAPKLAQDPKMLADFTNHPDFAMILGALQRVGMGSIVSGQPGAYRVNIPAEVDSLDQIVAKQIGAIEDPDEQMRAAGLFKSLSTWDPYSRAVAAQQANAEYTTPSEQKISEDMIAEEMGRLSRALTDDPTQVEYVEEGKNLFGWPTKKTKRRTRYEDAVARYGTTGLEERLRKQAMEGIASRTPKPPTTTRPSSNVDEFVDIFKRNRRSS